ncbi:MAG: carboxypeptidase Q [Halioglobus sp.]|jgi:hypothetical protein
MNTLLLQAIVLNTFILVSAVAVTVADMGVTTSTIKNTDSTDHRSFDAVGLPGFNFVQDPLDYNVNTHHSNVDHVGPIVPGDLMPRKPLPAPLPKKISLPEILRPQQSERSPPV